MSERQIKPRRFDPDNRRVVALTAACVVWVFLFLSLVVFTALSAAASAGLALALAVAVLLTGLGFHFAAALYAMALEAGFAVLAAIAGVIAAIVSAFT